MYYCFLVLSGLVVATQGSNSRNHVRNAVNQHEVDDSCLMIIDTFSSIDTFVPPYSGSKTLSPTFTLTGTMFPL